MTSMKLVKLFLLFCLGMQSLSVLAGGLQVEDAWVRAMPPGAPNSAGYLQFSNASDSVITVVAISSPSVRAVEIHESVKENDKWRMFRIAELSLQPGARVALAPGGKHLMLFGLASLLKEGETVSFTAQLADGEAYQFEAVVRR